MTVHVTEHAIQRYCERIENLPRELVRARIEKAARGIAVAARIGGGAVVRLGRARLILQGESVVTVVHVDQGFPRDLRRPGGAE